MPTDPFATSVVNVPIGGGVDDEEDEFLLAAPKAAVAENLVRDSRGSLRKLSGFTTKVTLGDVSGKALVRGEAATLVLGDAPATIYADGGDSIDSDAGAPLPHTVKLRRVRAGAGFVHDVQLAHIGGYTCVLYNVIGDVTNDATAGGRATLYDFHMEAAVVDSSGQVVWGPREIPDLRWLPRVEAITASGPNTEPVFALFGMGGGTPGSTVSSPFTTGRAPELFYARLDMGLTTTPTTTSLGLVFPSVVYDFALGGREGDFLDAFYKAYDTVADTAAEVAYVAFALNNGGKELKTARIGTTGAAATSTQVLTATANYHMAIGLDTGSDTLVVYDKGDAKAWYQEASGLGAFSSVVAPTLYDIDAAHATFLGVHEGDRPQTPTFFRDPDGVLYLNERIVTFTGSGPGDPVFGVQGVAWLPHVYAPVAVPDRTQAFYLGEGVRFVRTVGNISATGFDNIVGASTLEMYHREPHLGLGTLPTFDVPLFEGRLGDHNHRMYFYRTGSNTGTHATELTTLPCVTGQAAVTADNKILVPSAWLTSLQKNRNSYRLLNDATNRPGREDLVSDTTDGAGYFNDEQIVGFAEVSSKLTEHSAVPTEGGTVFAAGMVGLWSQTQVQPIALRAPVVAAYDGQAVVKTAARSVHVDAVNLGDPTVSPAQYADTPFNAALVLVLTTPDGYEVRSPPSIFFGVPGVSTTASPGTWPTECATIDVEIHPSTFSFFGSRKALDVELYVTTRTEDLPASSADIDDSTMTMVCRMPLQQDADGFFVVDTLQDYMVRDDLAGDPMGWQSPPHTNALYTVTNELAPDHPPAMQVLAQAGNFLFGLSAEHPYELWPTKPLVQGRAPEFSAQLTVRLPPDSGGAVSLGGAFDRLYVICRKGVWELPVLGGPDATGSGGFPALRRVYVGEECVGHAGTVETPIGLFYVTSSGPRLLTGDSDSDVGRSVANRLDWTALIGAVYLPEANRVVWASEAGMVFFDLTDGVWTTSSLGSIGVGRSGEELLRVLATGALVVADDAAHGDGVASTLINGTWTSPWISLDSVLGFKRLERIGMLLRFDNFTPNDTSPQAYGVIYLDIAYDYDDTVVDTFSWTGSQLQALRKRPLSVRPTRQKASSYKITVRDGPEVAAQVPESQLRWTLSGLNLKIRAKRGMVKLESGGTR